MTDSKAPLLDTETAPAALPPDQMADESANRLIDDLFDGVERALAGDADALVEGPAAPEVALAEDVPVTPELTMSFPSGGLPPVLLESAANAELAEMSQSLATVEAAVAEPPSRSTPPAAPKFWTLNRALLGTAGLTLLATLGLWLHQRQQVAVVSAGTATAPAAATRASTDAHFLEYLRRSLDVIAQNAPQTNVATTSVADVAIALNNGGSGSLPPISGALPSQVNGIPSAPGTVNVIERVYVPYPAGQQPPATAGAPGTSTANAPAPANSAAGTPTPAPVAASTLVGVLELGERSAALFEVGGVTQRVYIGERIANSGWSLVSVANEEAVIRRNGEVRTLYIGQQF